MEKVKLGIILIQIEEAHTTKWPLGFVDHPENHKTFEERVKRANEFAGKYSKFKNVYIDGWKNEFEEKFQAWPDRYVLIDKELKILEKSEYSLSGVIKKDYTQTIEEIIEYNEM